MSRAEEGVEPVNWVGFYSGKQWLDGKADGKLYLFLSYSGRGQRFWEGKPAGMAGFEIRITGYVERIVPATFTD